MTDRQTHGVQKDLSLNIHYQLTWRNLSTHPFMEKLPVLF